MKSKKWIIILIAILTLLVVVSVIKSSSSTNTIKVSSEKAALRTIVETVSASGKIQAEKKVEISSDVSGEIIEMLVVEGQNVEQGNLLLKINPDLVTSALNKAKASLNTSKANLMGTKARLAQAESQFQNTKASYNRNVSLYENKVISQAEFDEAKSRYEVAKSEVSSAKESVEAAKYNVKSAEATLNEAEENLGRTSIYSPMNGTVVKINNEQGERVVGTAQMAGTEILNIADLSVMEVEVEVNENDIVRVNIGDTADIEVDAYNNEKFKGIVTKIANSADVSGSGAEQVTNFDVRVRIDYDSYKHLIKDSLKQVSPFRPGMSANVDIRTKIAKDIVSVPIQAVTTRVIPIDEADTNKSNLAFEKKEECVFMVKNGVAKIVAVKTGIQNTSHIEIIKGLDEGDEIINGPYTAISETLNDGSEIEIVEKENLFTATKK